jgi:hypothetical protein
MVSVLKVCALNTAVQTLRVLFAPAGTGQASTLIAVRKSGPYAASEGFGPLREWVARELPARRALRCRPTRC